MPIVDITRDKFLELAQELCGAVAEMTAAGDRLLKETKYQLTDRDRVLNRPRSQDGELLPERDG